MEARNTGIEAKKPSGKCNDKDCPFHGKLRCRGRIFEGSVISTRMQKSAIIEWSRRYYLKKYERYEKRRSRVNAHNPACINAHEGDIVKISECRPISKTKNFVVVGVLGKEKGFKERIESEEEARISKEKKHKENEGDKIKNN